MRDEPRKHPIFLSLVALAAIGTVPIAFVGREVTYLLGLPTWLWSSIGFTLALSGLTAWGVLRYWRDDRFD
jgi:hypothetical protein